jgi:tetratricopeptide (TPR) repeat protein
MTMRFHTLLATLVAVVCFSGAANAQVMILKDGTRVSANEFKVAGGKIIRTVKVRDQLAESTLSVSQIGELQWPNAIELSSGRELMSQGKLQEAADTFKRGIGFFEPFKDVKGGGQWYQELMFAYVESLNQAGKFEDMVKMLPQLKSLKLTEQQKTRLKILELEKDRQTSTDYDAILGKADAILQETDDSETSASVWSIIGDVHTKRKDYEKALMAYLHVSVFYGTQVAKVPTAEMSAARSLAKMRRFEDATGFYNRIIQAYTGSAIAADAEKEKASINGLKNEDQNTDPNAAPAAGGAEKPKESTQS